MAKKERTKLTDFPGYVEALEVLGRLEARRDGATARMESIVERGAAATRKGALADAAAELVADPGGAVALADPVAAADGELHVAARAVEEQRRKVEELAQAIGADIARDLHPAHVELVARFVGALEQIQAAIRALVAFENQVAGDIGRMPAPLSLPWSESAFVGRKFRQAVLAPQMDTYRAKLAERGYRV